MESFSQEQSFSFNPCGSIYKVQHDAVYISVNIPSFISFTGRWWLRRSTRFIRSTSKKSIQLINSIYNSVVVISHWIIFRHYSHLILIQQTLYSLRAGRIVPGLIRILSLKILAPHVPGTLRLMLITFIHMHLRKDWTKACSAQWQGGEIKVQMITYSVWSTKAIPWLLLHRFFFHDPLSGEN